MKEFSEDEMLHRAAAYCSESEHSLKEVSRKVLAAGLDEEACQRILTRLQEENFINEDRLTHYFINDKLRFNKWGRIKIRYELQKKGIPASIYEKALSEIDQEFYHTLLSTLLKSRLKGIKGRDERDKYNKLLRFAASRGFEPSLTIQCLKDIFKGNTYNEEYDLE